MLPSQPHSALYSALVKFKSDSKVVDEKACRITWVGIGEKATEAATYAFDREAVKEVIEASGEEDLMAEFDAGEIQLHRHPKVVNNVNNRRPRIIKIRLRNQELRDKLLRHMRAGRQALTREFVHSYARPDYTKEEVEYDRLLRTKAGKMNRNEGKLAYVVRDLAIHKLKVPRELPGNYLTSALSSPLPSSVNNAGHSPVSSLSQNSAVTA